IICSISQHPFDSLAKVTLVSTGLPRGLIDCKNWAVESQRKFFPAHRDRAVSGQIQRHKVVPPNFVFREMW
ncbi:MAG: hypothetical protein QOE55_8413, partial [Acidobacteriaceae bacterium]|nr:hypothetical protein [Acidobacteriaceae bacterium]